MIFPEYLTAGLSFSAALTVPGKSAPDWSVTAVLRGVAAINLTADPDGSRYKFAIPASVTAAWVPGAYQYSIRVSDGNDVFEVERGEITIAADMAAVQSLDTSDHLRRVLAAIEAVIEKRASQDQKRYVIDNRELERTPLPDLLMLRDRYRAELRKVRAIRRGNLFGNQVKVHM